MSNEHHASPLADKILEVIEKNKITPKPKWHFFVREWVVWGVVVILLISGSLATALTIYIANASRFIEHQIAFSNIRYVFQMVPVLWILLFCTTVFYTVYAVRETKRGYKWSSSWLVVSALGVSFGIGAGIHACGLSEVIDTYLLTSMPMYKPLTGYHPKMWMDDDEGVIAGQVIKVEGNTFTLKKIDGEVVLVALTKDAKILIPFGIKEGARVRLIGTATVSGSESRFEAREVTPFRGRGGVRLESPHGVPPPPPARYNVF